MIIGLFSPEPLTELKSWKTLQQVALSAVPVVIFPLSVCMISAAAARSVMLKHHDAVSTTS